MGKICELIVDDDGELDWSNCENAPADSPVYFHGVQVGIVCKDWIETFNTNTLPLSIRQDFRNRLEGVNHGK